MDAGGTIKICQTDDVALIKRLHARTFPADEWIDESRENVFWVVTVDKRPVGFVSCQHLRRVRGLYLERIGVLRSHSHLGLARRLIRHVTRWAERQGFRHFITYVLCKNGPSLAAFIKAGWRVYSPQYQWGGKQAVYLRSA